jgi:hypothetical protein
MNALTSLRLLIGRDPTIRPVERVAKRRLKVLHGGEFISYLNTTLGITRLEAVRQEQNQLLQEASAILGNKFKAERSGVARSHLW